MLYNIVSNSVHQAAYETYEGKIETMESIRSKKQIFFTHIFTYFNLLNLILALLIIISGQYKNMLFMGVVISNTVIGIYQELKVKKLIDALSVVTALKAHKLKLKDNSDKINLNKLRTSPTEEIPIEELELEDIIRLSTGDQVPVDCEVIASMNFEANESLLTGESVPIKKKAGDMLYSGSSAVAGTVYAKVIHTGEENYASTIVQKARTKRRATSEMQITIKKIIKYVSFAIIPVGLLLFYIQRYHAGNNISDSLVSTVAGVLGMIPEGLVLLTSISFILGVGRLAKKKALVQEMEAIEALARVEVLCLDKTGTITNGELTVEEIHTLGDENENHFVEALENIIYAFEETNATSRALRNHFTEIGNWDLKDTIPFSSERKHMGIEVEENGKVVHYLLGAPEYLTKDSSLLNSIGSYEDMGFRVLLMVKSDYLRVYESTPLGIIIMSDVIKEDAPETFAFFEKNGVELKVISGDNPRTVSMIAKKAGLKNADKYIDARELPDDEKINEEALNYTVFGRVSPEKKRLIIKAFEKNEKVTGMIGDGVNDVLALKDADCGIAMAAGSDAAKQTAHIVLIDSNFSSLKDVVSEGRTVISNISRVSALYLTKTIYSLLLCVIFIILRKNYPFIPIQLSLIGGLAIGVPSFLLAFEHHEEVIAKGFKKQVLSISLPAAILMTVLLVVAAFLKAPLGIGSTLASTINLIIGAAVSFMVLIRVCRPMTRLRFIMCIVLISLFVISILIAPKFFGIIALF